MSSLMKWIGMALLGIGLFFALPKAKAQPAYTATYQDFYDGLSPYGQWIDDPQYGYVWLPDVGNDFRPYYSNGYWAMTEFGNTWVSNYPWGWAPFHYGRWTYDNYYGWLWIPDTQWGPAWVSWRSSSSYYGWAPLGPGLNINISIGAIPVDWWVFLSPTYLYDRQFYRYYGGYSRNRTIFYQTTIVNNTYYDNRYRTTYYCGPRADDYHRHTGRRPTVYTVTDNGRRGGTTVRGNRISMYRPAMNNVNQAAPSWVAQTDRNVGRRPQSFSGNTPAGRQQVLQQEPVRNTGRRPLINSNTGNNSGTPAGTTPAVAPGTGRRPASGNSQPVQREQQDQVRRQRDQQLQQQQIQEQNRQQEDQQRRQRDQQQQLQLQREQQQQIRQQRDQQIQQQRAQQQQMQQQRAQQQQMQQQQREQQLQQQRAQQQQMQQQQREQQLQQQRAQQQQMQQQQREQQLQQQRAQQQQMQQQREQQRVQQQQIQQRPQQQQPVQQAPRQNNGGGGGFGGRRDR